MGSNDTPAPVAVEAVDKPDLLPPYSPEDAGVLPSATTEVTLVVVSDSTTSCSSSTMIVSTPPATLNNNIDTPNLNTAVVSASADGPDGVSTSSISLLNVDPQPPSDNCDSNVNPVPNRDPLMVSTAISSSDSLSLHPSPSDNFDDTPNTSIRCLACEDPNCTGACSELPCQETVKDLQQVAAGDVGLGVLPIPVDVGRGAGCPG